MSRRDDFNDPNSFSPVDDIFARNRGRHQIKTGNVFGPGPMAPARPGRKRTGKTAGGWDEGTLW